MSITILDDNSVPREGLYFHHHRHPLVNQSDVVGHFNFLNMHHTLLTGYEYRRFLYSDRCDGRRRRWLRLRFYGNYTAIDLATLAETNPRITSFPIVRQTFSTETTNAVYWQDQIDVSRKIKVNVAGRYDDYNRHRDRIYLDDPGTITGVQDRHEDGIHLSRRRRICSSGQSAVVLQYVDVVYPPVQDIPADGSELKPRTGRAYEAGYGCRLSTTAFRPYCRISHHAEQPDFYRESDDSGAGRRIDIEGKSISISMRIWAIALSFS